MGCKAWRGSELAGSERTIPEEAAVAFTYNGTSYAVMMATPRDLEDFALGFSLTEGVIKSPSEIESLKIIEETIGIELRMRLTEPHATAFRERRRYLAGPTGCGLCGIESLGEALRAPARICDDSTVAPQDIMAALDALYGRQAINQSTRAVHGAAFYRRGEGLVAVREDVGRHNALDKLAGALARLGATGCGGLALLTSRLSVELVQKAAAISIPVLVAVSAPTALAVRTAEACGITLIAVARSDGFEVFTHPKRIKEERTFHALA
ncbi:MAG TPA: formate dehydrogenase accessory sulfurtransferase FdhD [Xanthobacteraceae bacterium]|nr:formate dehydrogenase accessory sulfurtransferase FdhD [Xanthobacteraceae bacterium]